jgi:RNA polymerase sigma-70 factor (ECF subfamily)
MLHLTKLLADLLPEAAEVFALAAQVRYAEARRPARLDSEGIMVPLSEQDPSLWRRDLIEDADGLLIKAVNLAPATPRTLQACLQQLWCARLSLDEAAPWLEVLHLYNRLLAVRDDAVVRLNRAVALAEVEGPAAALSEVQGLACSGLDDFLPYHAVCADLLRRMRHIEEARAAYAKAIALDPSPAERRWLERQTAGLSCH